MENGPAQQEQMKKPKKPTNVITEIRVMPEGLEIDLVKLQEQVKALGAQSIELRDIAFGLKAIHAVFAIPDSDGGAMERVEQGLASIPGVAAIEVVSMGREVDLDDFK
ncbi:MAG: elongation factor 1-beta [archaeon]